MIDPKSLLKKMISIPSISMDEAKVADLIFSTMQENDMHPNRFINNVWALHPYFEKNRPTLLLNSHLDTVRPVESWTKNPYEPQVEGEKLFGLGSNDAGASVVSLLSLFQFALTLERLPFNLLIALTCEEERMGPNGMRAFIPELAKNGIQVDMALVGEPTGMLPAIGERGLIVFDAVTHGKSGHAARNEGDNAIYKAISDINSLRNYKFSKQSELLGPIKISVTQIDAGTQHNVVPDKCSWVVDVRTTDAYTNPQIVDILSNVVESTLTARSTRVWASAIPTSHPLAAAAIAICGEPFVSPTTSDMALLHNIPSLKLGPGQSFRSHTADEYIFLNELDEAILKYKSFFLKLIEIYETME